MLFGLLISLMTPVFAEGFICDNGDYRVSVYHYNHPTEGTRNGSVMVLVDLNQEEGSQTIGTFLESKGTLANLGGPRYVARVDLRAKELRGGEYLFGTRLSEVKTLTLDLDGMFSYSSPLEHGEWLPGVVKIRKRSGGSEEFEMDCYRYLKHP